MLSISAGSFEKLRDAGVEPAHWHLPAELRERVPSLPPLRRHDLRVLTAEFDADLEALLHGAGPGGDD